MNEICFFAQAVDNHTVIKKSLDILLYLNNLTIICNHRLPLDKRELVSNVKNAKTFLKNYILSVPKLYFQANPKL